LYALKASHFAYDIFSPLKPPINISFRVDFDFLTPDSLKWARNCVCWWGTLMRCVCGWNPPFKLFPDPFRIALERVKPLVSAADVAPDPAPAPNPAETPGAAGTPKGRGEIS